MKEYIIDTSGVFGKSPCIYKRVGNVCYPIVYLRRAKNVLNEDYQEVLEILTKKSKRK